MPTVINSEAERLAWVASEPNIENTECIECSGQFPMYLAGNGGQMQGHPNDNGDELGHGLGSVWRAIYSYIKWKKGPNFAFTSWRRSAANDMGPLTGQALFVSKSGACGSVDQWNDQGRGGHGQTAAGCSAVENQLAVRSENQYQINGYSVIEVFVPANQVSITNVVTHSTGAYTAEPIAVGQPFYTDRMYALTTLPDFLKGLVGIKTPCDVSTHAILRHNSVYRDVSDGSRAVMQDKHSDPTDLSFLCFDINQRAAVYILYDKASPRSNPHRYLIARGVF